MEYKKSLEDFTRFSEFKEDLSLELVRKFKKKNLDAGDIEYNIVAYRPASGLDFVTIFQVIVKFEEYEILEEKDFEALEATEEYVKWIVQDIYRKEREIELNKAAEKWERIKGLNL